MAWQWPGGKPIAVIFNVCLEAWSDGKAPGISPMGNPLPAGAARHHGDLLGVLWREARDLPAAGRARRAQGQGERDDQRHHRGARARSGEGGGRCRPRSAVAFFLTMDVIPALLTAEENKGRRASRAVRHCSAMHRDEAGAGWLSPRGTSGPELPRLLAEAGYKWYGDVFDDDLPYVQRFGICRSSPFLSPPM